MARKSVGIHDATNLRRRAEERLREQPTDLGAVTPAEAQRLLHDLQVHQIELEMQNEELRRAQQEIEALQARYFDLYDLAPVGYCTTSEQGLILEANFTAAQLLGVDRIRLVKRPLTRYIAPDDQDIYYLHRRQLFDTGAPQGCELRMLRQDGVQFWAHLQAIATQERDDVPVCRITLSDVTQRKRAEEERLALELHLQQAQRLESLGVLAGGIAHDFNNLLTGVLGYADLALKELSPGSAARDNITQIGIAARRAAELCRQVLAYSGTASFALERVDLRDLIEEMTHLLRISISGEVILHLNLARGLPPIQADPSQIRQIVMNLIVNASEAIGDQGGSITVSAGATRCDEDYLCDADGVMDPAPGAYVYLEVADTGCGMDSETRARIFEPFFSTKFVGRGLGLSAVLGIVRAYHGALKVHSELGKGSQFRVLFPILEIGDSGASVEESPPCADGRRGGTILLVDDEEGVRAVGAQMLERLGFTVLTASDGREAIELYREHGHQIHLTILDLTMPSMSGGEVAGQLRRLNPEARIVLASGYAAQDVAGRFAGTGLVGVLQKPYLLDKLSEFLAGLMPECGEIAPPWL